MKSVYLYNIVQSVDIYLFNTISSIFELTKQNSQLFFERDD